jgi:hypothetical protein
LTYTSNQRACGDKIIAVSSPEDGRRQRAAGRRGWLVRRFALGDEPRDDLRGVTTPEQRLEMMWELALQAWYLSGRELPNYPRDRAPGRIVRPS